jgi:hypothetical protein
MGPTARLDVSEKGKNVVPLSGIELKFFGRPTRRLVTILTELSRQLIDVMECEKNSIVSCKELCIIQISVSVLLQLICSSLYIICVLHSYVWGRGEVYTGFVGEI